METIEEELASIENNRAQVELSKKIKEYETEIAKEQGEMDDVEKVKEEIDGWEKEQSRVKSKQSQLDEKIAKWHANSKSKTELEMMRNDKRAKQDQIRRSKQHIEEELDKFFEMSDNSEVDSFFWSRFFV